MIHKDKEKVISSQAYLIYKKVRQVACELAYSDNLEFVERVCKVYNLVYKMEPIKDDRYNLFLARSNNALLLMQDVWHSKDKQAEFIKGTLFGYDTEQCIDNYCKALKPTIE